MFYPFSTPDFFLVNAFGNRMYDEDEKNGDYCDILKCLPVVTSAAQQYEYDHAACAPYRTASLWIVAVQTPILSSKRS